jgi:hypothetical protein
VTYAKAKEVVEMAALTGKVTGSTPGCRSWVHTRLLMRVGSARVVDGVDGQGIAHGVWGADGEVVGRIGGTDVLGGHIADSTGASVQGGQAVIVEIRGDELVKVGVDDGVADPGECLLTGVKRAEKLRPDWLGQVLSVL